MNNFSSLEKSDLKRLHSAFNHLNMNDSQVDSHPIGPNVIKNIQSQPSKDLSLYGNPYNENQNDIVAMGIALDEKFLQSSNGYFVNLTASDAYRYLAQAPSKTYLIRNHTEDGKIIVVNFMSLTGEVGEFRLGEDEKGGWRATDGYWYQTIQDFITYNFRHLQNAIIPSLYYKTPSWFKDDQSIDEEERTLNERMVQPKFIVGQHISATRISLLVKDFGIHVKDVFFDFFGGNGCAYKGELTPQEIAQYLKHSDGNCIWHKIENHLFCSAYDATNSQIIEVCKLENVNFGTLQSSDIFQANNKCKFKITYPLYFRLKSLEKLSDESLIKKQKTRSQAESDLQNQKIGTYIIRSSSDPQATAISVRNPGQITHYSYDAKGEFSWDKLKYTSLEDLIKTFPILFTRQYKE